MNYYEIGQRIRKYRKIKGLSQEQLAEAVDISVTHLSHIETGNTKLSLPVFVEITKALEIQANDLLADEISGREIALGELADIANTCSDKELRIVADIARATKNALNKYNQYDVELKLK